MAEIHKLSPGAVSKKKTPGFYNDGGGLYLNVTATGAKSWIFRFKQNKKSQKMGLGSTNSVSLAEAREKAAKSRKLLSEGINPLSHRMAERTMAATNALKTKPFSECAKAYIRSHSTGWKSAKHISQWHNTLSTYAYPHLGTVPVSQIDTTLVLEVLEPIWVTKTETATRIRGRMEAILDWASVSGYRSGPNPALWKGHLDKLLPPRSKVKPVVHHPALPFQDIYQFMLELRSKTTVSAKALEFLILTATRTIEAIGACWSEMDANKSLWTIPAERTKTGKEHRVPLSPPAVAILEEMLEVKVSDYVFPSKVQDRPLSNMALLQLLKRMSYPDITVHGFRSTFRDWVSEVSAHSDSLGEMALAHTVGNKVEAAYRRGDLLDKRRLLMADWAKFCTYES